MTDESQWVRETFDLVANGGLWLIPRSGLTFRKGLHGEDTLTLTERGAFPADGHPVHPDIWAEYQEADFQDVKLHIEGAGINVFDETDGLIRDH